MVVLSRSLALAFLAASAAADMSGPEQLQALPEECDAHDSDACQEALSLRQLRSGVLAPEEALERRRAPRLPPNFPEDEEPAGYLGPTTLLQTLAGKSANSFYVYHQTSIDICYKIVETGFRPGSRGWCGGAIYFADSMRGTFGEAVGPDSHQGCIIRALVDMGKIKGMPPTCDSQMTGAKLKEMGYDSIRFNDGAGTGWQYVIYDPSRVKQMTVIWVDHKHQMEFNAKFNITDNETEDITVPGAGAQSTKDATATQDATKSS